MRSHDEIEITLIGDDSDSQPFLSDICAMLIRRAAHAGTTLEPIREAAEDRRRLRGTAITTLLAPLLGIHRAQIAPRQDARRIRTVKVAVSEPDATPSRVIRTYNYPLGIVTDHLTGERLRLDDVLAGQV